MWVYFKRSTVSLQERSRACAEQRSCEVKQSPFVTRSNDKGGLLRGACAERSEVLAMTLASDMSTTGNAGYCQQCDESDEEIAGHGC
jgi:hypothetical protein